MPKSEYAEPGTPRDLRQPPFVELAGIRRLLGLKQAHICEKVAVLIGKSFTVGAFSAIETGQRGASPEVLAAIQTALGLHAEDLKTSWAPSHSRRKAEVEDPAA